jgi:hypothetical protein
MNFKQQVPAHSEEQVRSAGTKCDRCGEWIKKKGLYDASEITIEAKIGDCWPDDDCRRLYEMDCCQNCWPVALAALTAAGFAVREGFVDDDMSEWLDGKDDEEKR